MSFQIKYVYELVDKISPNVKKIQANLNTSSAQIQRTAATIGVSFDKIAAKIEMVGKRSSAIGKALFIRATLPVALLGRSFVKAASDYQESLNKVDVAFGNSSKKVREFAVVAGKKFGIDRGSALDMSAMFGDMATGMGISQDKAAGLATSLVGLAGDLASFKNISVDMAQTAIAGVFTGETESLKKLGIVMTEANLQQFALTQGIHKKIDKLKQSEKVLLRYNYIVAMSKNSVGDFARTSEGFANQSRILASRWRDLAIVWGSVMLPYAVRLVNVMITLVEKFTNLNPTLQKTIMIVAGVLAVAAPLLILFGFMASSVVSLITLFKLAGGAALIFGRGLAFIQTVMSMNPLGALIKGAMLVALYWKDIVGWIKKAIDFAKTLGLVKWFKDDKINPFGVPSPTPEGQNTSVNSDDSNINKNENRVTAGGQLDVNIKGLPKGSSVGFTPLQNNFLNLGINSIYAGGR